MSLPAASTVSVKSLICALPVRPTSPMSADFQGAGSASAADAAWATSAASENAMMSFIRRLLAAQTVDGRGRGDAAMVARDGDADQRIGRKGRERLPDAGPRRAVMGRRRRD